MQAVERIGRTIRRQPCDRPPVAPQIFAHAAKLAGLGVDDYLESGARAAFCQLAAWRHYRYDAVFAVLDLAIEAEALGGGIVRHPGLYPAVGRPPLEPDQDFSRLAVPDPATSGRMPEVLAMASTLRAATGDEALVTGLIQGPMTMAIQLLGMERALFLAADHTDRFLQLLDFATLVGLRFGLAQLAAGAHAVIVFDPAACPEVVPPGLFREMIGPRIARQNEAFAQAGAHGTWLHIAGRTDAILPLYSGFGIHIGNVDYCVDIDRLLSSLGDDRLCVDGTIKPLAFVTGTPEDIGREARALLARFAGRGGLILSSGCEIPPEAEIANVAALVEAAHSWRADP